jgi:hypothetical protein
MEIGHGRVMLIHMKTLTSRIFPAILAVGLVVWTGRLHSQAQSSTAGTNATGGTGAAGGDNSVPTHNVNNTGGAGINGVGNATSGGATSSTSGGNATGGQTSAGMTSSGDTTHVNTAGGATPAAGNSGVTSTPPSGVTPGTGASPNPQ